ncbi:hypothetical protein GCK72_010737 [Caenorhabditis remanei]|uniref:Uncharacterized protein n=1 Tax=Caenorhabditis remanei TaxID=31234 RepID=A0A2P4VJA7_CAERE|nr:hypothetical protein GCK72_010737 [Caenorhabditis remanei]KAF1762475.1 hypothetical protein GCK72_010737 [Caenorhabditis remanei]
MTISFVTLHDREDLLMKSATFLNTEWPRSMGSREHSQRKSCRQTPPMSFLLLETETDEIIGHSRVTRLPNRETALWIESVMIKKDQRGRGLGKYLMLETEKWMMENGYDEGFLATEDQCRFYESIGYENCDPIVHSTTATCVFAAMDHFQNAAAANPSIPSTSSSSSTNSSTFVSSSAPIPPPPPPPKMVTRSTSPISKHIDVNITDHQYMRKRIKPFDK